MRRSKAAKNVRLVDGPRPAERQDMKMAMPKATMSAGKPYTRAAVLKGTRPAIKRATTKASKWV